MNPTLIVCPIEFSSSSKAALAHALDLARWHDAQLHAVHVHSERRGSALPGADRPEHPSYRHLVDFIGCLNRHDVAVTPAVLTGDPVSAGRVHQAQTCRSRRGSAVWTPRQRLLVSWGVCDGRRPDGGVPHHRGTRRRIAR